MFSKSHKNKVLNKYPLSMVRRIRSFIKAGFSAQELIDRFKVTEYEANVFYIEFSESLIIEENRIIGYKTQPYYEEEFPPKPVYRLEDLEAEEKMISKKDTSTKLWTWEE
jgi:hypothetical protein